ncbi:unnamed protein product, partial [Prorocentrum cordatum]
DAAAAAARALLRAAAGAGACAAAGLGCPRPWAPGERGAARCEEALLGAPEGAEEPTAGPAPSEGAELLVGGFPFQRQRVLRAEDGGEQRLEVAGTAVLRMARITLAQAALYLPPLRGSNEEGLDARVTKSLELRYAQAVPADAFRYLTSHYVSANGLLSPAVEPFVEAFNAFYVGMSPGHRYRLDYCGRAGTLTLQAWRGDAQAEAPGGSGWVRLGRLHCGARAAEAILSVWFGPVPFSPGMKADLLRGRPAAG